MIRVREREKERKRERERERGLFMSLPSRTKSTCTMFLGNSENRQVVDTAFIM